MMAVLPRVRFDAAYVEVRRVHPVLPLVEWRGVSYSVPPDALGQLVECRAPLGEDRLEIRLAGTTASRCTIWRLPGAGPIWDPDHRAAAAEAALTGHEPPRRHLTSRRRHQDCPQPATTPSTLSTCPATTSTERGQ